MDTFQLSSETLRSLAAWDYIIIGFYALMISAIGPICLRLNKSPSDYFRGGGNMLWWVGAVSAMATMISTWTFTGGAAKCYLDGFVFPVFLLVGTALLSSVLWFLAPRLRRMRVITAMEAVFRRFGMGTEQFYTWFTLPLGLFMGGIGLNTLGVFMSAIFQMDLAATIVMVGVLVTALAVVGGQWAISFFGVIQTAILFMVVALVTLFSLAHPMIGGLGNFAQALPRKHIDFGMDASLGLVWVWIFWQAFLFVMIQIDLRNCGKFVRVKDDSSARKMALAITLPQLLLLFPVLVQIPSMCAAVVYPDLKTIFPQLKNPEEGAWLAMAMTVLPQGLLGLMVCVMFGAASDSLDAALNSNAGFFVRNVYFRYINPRASDRRQIMVGKIVTACFGLATIGVALLVNSLRTLNLFDMFLIINAMLLPPMVVPMVMGLFIKRTPNWSGWSTVVVGLVAGVLARSLYSPTFVQAIFGLDRALTVRETIDGQSIFISFLTWAVSTLWFLGTMRFWDRANAIDRVRVDELFSDLAMPVNHLAEGGRNQDGMQNRIVGILSMCMGGFLIVCSAIPNPWEGRICFVFIGGVLFTMGFLFYRNYRRLQRALDAVPGE